MSKKKRDKLEILAIVNAIAKKKNITPEKVAYWMLIKEIDLILKEPGIWQKVKCFFYRHKYCLIETFKDGTKKIGCRFCSREWRMNDRMDAFLPWDQELEELQKDN